MRTSTDSRARLASPGSRTASAWLLGFEVPIRRILIASIHSIHPFSIHRHHHCIVSIVINVLSRCRMKDITCCRLWIGIEAFEDQELSVACASRAHTRSSTQGSGYKDALFDLGEGAIPGSRTNGGGDSPFELEDRGRDADKDDQTLHSSRKEGATDPTDLIPRRWSNDKLRKVF